MRTLALILFVLILAAGTWGVYRTPSALPAPGELQLTALPPHDGTGPALVAIQPWMDERHYQSETHLRERLDAYLLAAAGAGYLPGGTVVVFPEHVGTWLVAARAPRASFSAGTTRGAMIHLIAANPLPFALALPGSPETDRFAAAVFRMRARRMAHAYHNVFASLARRHGVTIVAGSIVLPDPAVENGRLIARDGPLYNTSAVFAPDGSIHPHLVRKVHPIPEEAGFTAAAQASALPVFDTPAGRLGVLICADSWHPDVYAVLAEAGTDLVAVPAFLQPSGIWSAPWGGYTTGWPQDVDRGEARRLTEGEAWMRHALAGRLGRAGARHGATAFLRGDLWDLGSDGVNILVDGSGARLAGQPGGASVSILPLSAAGASSE